MLIYLGKAEGPLLPLAYSNRAKTFDFFRVRSFMLPHFFSANFFGGVKHS